MIVKLELREGAYHGIPTSLGMQRNIDALKRLMKKETPKPEDDILMLDNLSILEGIKKQLFEMEHP